MKVNPQGKETRELYKLLTSVIVPRPIALVSTVNRNGLPNVAPFCFFTGITPAPPTIAFSVIRRGDEYQKKDTIRNIEAIRDFVINIVDESLAQAMNHTSGSFPPDMSEFDLSGLTVAASEFVKSPRVAEAPISLECRLKTILDLGDLPASLVIGEIVQFHIRDQILNGQGEIDMTKLKPIGRLQETLYAKMSDLFEMNRPA